MARIGIDISQLVYGRGVSIYTDKLVRNLLKLDKSNSYVLFAGTLRQKKYFKEYISSLAGTNCLLKLAPLSPKLADLFWNKLDIFPIETFTGKLDLFHSSDWAQPSSKSFKATTIHDLSPILLPKMTDPKIVSVHKNRLKRVFEEVNLVIVPSLASKNDLMVLGYPEKKIRVIYEGLGHEFEPVSKKKISEIKKKYKIFGDYILIESVGLRKNTQGAIKGFELAKAGKDVKLVVVGAQPKNLKVGRGVRFIGEGFIKRDELSVLYSGARALLYPSYHEGFGLPILQAFSTKCPVITSNLSSMKEIAGNAAALVDPYDPSSIAEGIIKALRGPKTLIRRGLKRVNRYSWTRTAKETLDVYNELIG